MLSMMIEPCLKFYTLPSLSRCMILRSRSQTLNVYVKTFQCQFVQSFDKYYKQTNKTKNKKKKKKKKENQFGRSKLCAL